MSIMHFISGKGGTGKSTLTAGLAHHLANKNEGPVLLLEVQGSGRSLDLLGAQSKTFENAPIYPYKNLWAARMLPRESFRQYFELLLSMGNENSMFANATSGIRERVVDLVFQNKVVSAFIDTCPGLEPAVLLGKLHWEATSGGTPESGQKWAHVIVDAPATGHGVMLFKSAFALTEVFSSGVIARQANEIKRFVSDPNHCRVYLTSTVEELPVAETLELVNSFNNLGMKVQKVFFNRCLNYTKQSSELENTPTPLEWQKEYEFEMETFQDQQSLFDEFNRKLPSPLKQSKIPELLFSDRAEFLKHISESIAGDFL